MKEEISKKFKEANLSDLPDFYSYRRPLDKALWILWIAKDKFGVDSLSSEEIAFIIMDSKEMNISEESINQALRRAGSEKIFKYSKNGKVYYRIMKPGKEYLGSQIQSSLEVFYFKPGKKYTNRRILVTKIFDDLKGELKIVDPYCGERTLDILSSLKGRSIKFLTRAKNLQNEKRFQRAYRELKSENSKIEIRDYPKEDIHDRYIISSNRLVILGHSIRNLGGKESFAINLDKDSYISIFKSLSGNFDTRWSGSNPI